MTTLAPVAAPITPAAAARVSAAEEQSRRTTRDEVLIGLGISALGGLVGFFWGVQTNAQSRSVTGFAPRSVWYDALKGFLLGFILAFVAILIFRTYQHSRILRAQTLVQTQQYNAQRYAAVAQQARYLNQTATALGSGVPQESLAKAYASLLSQVTP